MLNIAAAGMSILKKDPQDFVKWLKALEDKPSKSGRVNLLADYLGKAYDYGLCEATARPGGFYPRLTFGYYVMDRISAYKTIANGRGIDVQIGRASCRGRVCQNG